MLTPVRRAASISVWALVLFLTGCSGWQSGLPASGRIGNHAVDTRVDSEIARYYLAAYLAGLRLAPETDRRIDQVYQAAPTPVPDRRELKRLSQEFSMDFAALYFADRLARMPLNQRYQAFFDRVMDETEQAFSKDRVKLSSEARQYIFFFVPGYLYQSHRTTGADFAVPREMLSRLGMPYHFVETDEDGTIEANADRVAAAIRQYRAAGLKIILVSASKSGPEVALALTRLGEGQSRQLAAWINIVGALRGSPLADDHLRHRLQYIVGKVDVEGVKSLATASSRQRFETFRFSKDILIINYIGIPLTGSISSRARMGYNTISAEGPNDGLSLLPDLLVPGAPTLVEMGSDHFLLNDRMDIKTVALATAVIEWHGRSDQGL